MKSQSLLMALMACGLGPVMPVVGPAAVPAAVAGTLSAAGGAKVPDVKDLKLDWSLSRSERGLKVTYTLRNGSAQKIWVLDQLIGSGGSALELKPSAVIVENGDGPGEVALVRGYVDPGHPVAVRYAPGGRGVAPGESVTGSAEVALPLRAWHPYGRPEALRGEAQSVVLRLGVVGADVQWTQVPLRGGSATVPTLPTVVPGQRFVVGEKKPLPK